MNFLKGAKRAILATARGCGAFALSANSGRRNSRLLVIGCHGGSLADEHEVHPGLFLSPRNFRERLDSIKGCGCNVLDLEKGLDLLYRGELPERAVVLTFDDGTYDVLKVVWPMLKEY